MKHPPAYGPDAFAADTGVSRETLDRLRAYADLLVTWNAKINLVGRGTVADLWWRHMRDSAQLVPLLPEKPVTLVDMGSGAGFPGLVLAAMGQVSAHLIEGDQRKCAFLREAARVMGLGVKVHACRTDAAPVIAADVITARALAPLADLLVLAERFSTPSTIHIYPKGQSMEGELTYAHKIWTMQLERFPSRTESAASILRFSEVRRVQSGSAQDLTDSAPVDVPKTLKTPISQRILAISNQKGGVGKTTTAVNLATAIAAVHKKVLVIDLDPQGNASTSLGIDQKHRAVNIYHVLNGEAPLSTAIVPTAVPGLFVVPSGVDLAAAELELVDLEDRQARLRNALTDQAGDFDFILIDCPPSLGLLTLNALVAAHAVVVPLQAEFLALEGISHLAKTIERVRKAFNPGLELQGIVLTMVDARNKLSEMVESDVRGYYGAKVYKTTIPRNVRISEAPSHGKPVLLYDFASKGARAYLDLAGEVLKREQGVAA